jgi:thioredoxin 1
VDFYADWCGPCKMLGPILEGLENIEIVKVNVDEYSELSRKYGVMSIPCLILFDNSKEIKRNIGFANEQKIKDFLK